MPVDFGFAHGLQRCRLPARPVVLVDDHRSDALVEIMPVHEPRYDAQLRPHAVLKRPRLAAAHLRERELEAGRRFAADRRRGFFRPARIASPFRLRVQPSENILDPPTPPPMTMPSISATYGLGKCLMNALSAYSSRQNGSISSWRPARPSS